MYKDFTILMKEGCETQKPTLDNIKGIVVPFFGDKKILVFPKYKDCALLKSSKSDELKLQKYSEAEAIFNEDNKAETDEWLRLGSEAAEHVRKFGADLPSFTMAAAIIKNREALNEIALQIEGADIIRSWDDIWASCRYNTSSAWIFSGNDGYAISYNFYSSFLAVPATLLS